MTMLTQQDYQNFMYGLHHASRPRDWAEKLALRYSANFNTVGATTEGNLLSAFGWTVTGTLAAAFGSGADLATSADKGTPGGIKVDTATDVLDSPPIFMDWAHATRVAKLAFMKDLPRYLICDAIGTFAANNNETGSGLGLTEDGGSPAVANDHMACIFCDGTSFKLRSGAATSSAIVAADTNPHEFRIVIDRIANLAYGFVDNFAKNAGQSIAIQDDEWPVSFGVGTVSGGSNFPTLTNIDIRYAWAGWY